MSEIQLKKNKAAEIMFAMVDSASPDLLKAGVSVVDDAYYKDATGSWTSLSISDAVSEIGSTGMYTVEMSEAERNHDLTMIKLTGSGSAETIIVIRSFGSDIDEVNAVVDEILTDVGAIGIPPTAQAIRVEIEATGSMLNDVKAKTDGLPASPAPSGEYDTPMGYVPSDLGDVPTGAELISEHGSGSWITADTSGLAVEANVEGHVTSALNTYDGIKRSEATSDKDEILVAVSGSDVKIVIIDTVVDAIKERTDNLPDDPADQSLLILAISGSESNIRGADGDDLKTISDQIDGISGEVDWTDGEKEQIRSALGVDGVKTAISGSEIIDKVDGLNDLSAAEVNTEVAAALGTYDGPTRGEATTDKDEILVAVSGSDAKIVVIDVIVDAVKAKTDNLPDDPAGQSVIILEISGSESNIRGADDDDLKTISDQIDGISVGGDWTSGEKEQIRSALGVDGIKVVVSGSEIVDKIDGQNDLSGAEVQVEVGAALSTYDGPTRGEATTDKDEVLTAISGSDVKLDANAVELATIKGHTEKIDDATDGLTTIRVIVSGSDVKLDLLQTDLDNPDQYKADVGALAIEANVEDHVGTALTAYDGPTNEELVLRTLPSEGYFDPDTDEVTVGDKTGYELSATGIDAILDELVEGDFSLRMILRLVVAALAGKTSGGGTATVTIRSIDDTQSRIVAVTDEDGNRIEVTLNAAE